MWVCVYLLWFGIPVTAFRLPNIYASQAASVMNSQTVSSQLQWFWYFNISEIVVNMPQTPNAASHTCHLLAFDCSTEASIFATAQPDQCVDVCVCRLCGLHTKFSRQISIWYYFATQGHKRIHVCIISHWYFGCKVFMTFSSSMKISIIEKTI